MDYQTPIQYLEQLQKFPHRGIGTEYAAKAANYIESVYKSLGLKTGQTNYKSFCYSWYFNGLIGFVFFLSAVAVIYSNYLLAVIFLGLLFPMSLVYKYAKKILPTPLTVHDVYSIQNPKNEDYSKTIVVMAHYDTARVTLGLKLVKFIDSFNFGKDLLGDFERKPFYLRATFLPIYLAFLLVIMGVITKPFFAGLVFFVLVPLGLIILLVMSVVFVLPAFSPFVPGAFDNGSGVATVLSLAEHLKDHKLKNTRLIFMNEGSEEGGINGFDEFAEAVELNPDNTIIINLDSVGADKLYIADGECDSSFGIAVYYEKRLFRRARGITRKHKYQIIDSELLQLATDAMPLCKMGYHVATTLTAVNENGYYDDYHQMTDTIDKVNPKTMELCRDYLLALIKALD